MSDQSREFNIQIIKNCKMIDAIRIFKHVEATVESCRNYLGVSRATADKLLKNLQGPEGTPELYEKPSRTQLKLRHEAAMFLGISVGRTHIRMSLLGLDFEPFSQGELSAYTELKGCTGLSGYLPDESTPNSFCYKTPSGGGSLQKTREFLIALIRPFLKQAKKSRCGDDRPFPLMAIGIAVTGPVDYNAGLWVSAPARFTSVRDISLKDLLGFQLIQDAEELSISFILENNAKAAAISEYQYLMEHHGGDFKGNIGLLYIGTGIGFAAVIDQALFRGNRNLSEIGQLKLGEAPREIGEVCVVEETLRSPEDYIRVLPYVLTAINCIMGIENIVLVGHSLKKYDQLIPELLERRVDYTITSTQSYCQLSVGRGCLKPLLWGRQWEHIFLCVQ